MSDRPRIGLVGYGYIGAYVYEQITTRPDLGLDIAFVHNRSPGRVAGLPPEHVLEDLGAFAGRDPDLVVEVAHPDITRDHGGAFLQTADYMPLSLTAFADAELEADSSTRRAPPAPASSSPTAPWSASTPSRKAARPGTRSAWS